MREARNTSSPPATFAVTETPSGPEATESAMARRTTRIPSSANTPANALDASGSSCEANRERTSMVTREPSREKSCAISRAT